MKIVASAAMAALLISVMPSAASVTAAGSGRARVRPADVGVVVPFELANKTIYIRVEVGGKPLWFILDTGIKYTVIDLETARKLALPLDDPVPVGGGGTATVTGNLLKGGKVVLPHVPGGDFPLFLALPLDDLARLSGRDVSGVIGFDLFSRFVVEVDYRARRIVLHDPARYRYGRQGASLPITFNAAGHPVVGGEVIDGRGPPMAGRFVFDIGSGATVILNRPFVEQGRFLVGGRSTVPWLAGYGIGGGVNGRVGRIDAFRIGPYLLPQPVAIFSQAPAGAFSGSEEQGNIGAGLLDRFRIILDYPQKRIILKPESGLGRRFDYEKTGVMLTTPGPPYTTYQVEAVADPSPAWAAGIRPGDRLVAVNGRPAASFTLSALREKLQQERKLRLTIERNGRRFETTLTPRPMI
ncbi:MAG TPA: aspartyl protease family protein [Allosphingosinicella sp.]|jgi:hypothetical protein